MKISFRLSLLTLLIMGTLQGQSNHELINHYKAYHKQMQSQGDVQGVINAMTHLIVLEPNVNRKDTLAAIYMNNNKHVQALNLIGIEKQASDSDIAVEVKAVSLKSLNEPARAIEHFEELFKRQPNVNLAYELADLKIQIGDLTGARLNLTYGIANVTEEMNRVYYETQTPYQVPLRAGLLYLKGIANFTENPQTNHDSALTILDQALQLAPNFNLASIAKEAITTQKNNLKAE